MSAIAPQLESPTPPLTTAALRGWVEALRGLTEAADDAERIDRIRLLEEIKAAAAAAQARETVAFKASQLEVQRAAGVRARDLGKGIGAQVALARRESPHRGGRLVGLAEALGEMPHTMRHLERGQVSEWRATVVARETACLSREDRGKVDAELAGRLPDLGDRQVEAEARRIAYRLDPQSFTRRSSKAAAERRVTLRPAPDTMSILSGLLPAAQGVAAFAALSAHADSLRTAGDGRSRGQIMADTLVERVTGRASAPPTWAEQASSITWESAQASPAGAGRGAHGAAQGGSAQGGSAHGGKAQDGGAQDGSAQGSGARGGPAGGPAGTASDSSSTTPSGDVAVELHVIMTDQALLGHGAGADEPALLEGYGPIPAPLARLLAAGRLGADHELSVSLRRLYTDPKSGALVSMESTRRAFTGALRRFVTTRDRTCRTPWCDAPIRHIDHAVPVELNGSTSDANGQGLCEACNYAKQAPGWRAQPAPEGAGTAVEVSTPTGHRYRSEPPRPPGAAPPQRDLSTMEQHFLDLILAA